MALCMILVSQEGVCTVIITSCMYVDQGERVSNYLNEIWKQVQILHGVQTDNTFLGFAEVWNGLHPGYQTWGVGAGK